MTRSLISPNCGLSRIENAYSYSLTTLVCISLALIRPVPPKVLKPLLSFCNPAATTMGMPEDALRVVEPALLNAAENSLKEVGELRGTKDVEDG